MLNLAVHLSDFMLGSVANTISYLTPSARQDDDQSNQRRVLRTQVSVLVFSGRSPLEGRLMWVVGDIYIYRMQECSRKIKLVNSEMASGTLRDL